MSVTVKLNEKRDVYKALLSNLGVKNAEPSDSYVRQFEKLLVGGIWCIVTLKYQFEEDQKGSFFSVTDLKPIQMPNRDVAALFEPRLAFTDAQWIDALIRSTGIEPTCFKEGEKWHLLAPFPEAMIDSAFLTAFMPTCRAGKFQKCGQSFSPTSTA